MGFHVDYINTGEFKSHDDLRDQLMEILKEENPDIPEIEIERKVLDFSLPEVERQAKKYDLLVYQVETHIPRVVTSILDKWEHQSKNREFNAILTVAYKNRVIAYYNEFKKQLKQRGEKLNIAMTFSFGNENDPDNVPIDEIKRMFKDYSEFTGIEFVAGDKKHGEMAYFEDVIERATKGGSGRSQKNIDLIIVADQLLTGYDSKRLNTLYVDRHLELQHLIQAYSRTNRIFGNEKEFGSIVNFQYPEITKETVNIALKLYGSGGSSSRVIVETYKVSVEKFKICVENMIPTLSDPSDWQLLLRDENALEIFMSAFKAAAEQLNFVEQYYEYKWDDESFGIDEHTWLKYKGAYRNLLGGVGGPNPDPTEIRALVGRTRLAGTQVIDANHILSLIGSKVKNVEGIQTVDSETLRIIHEQIQELSDMGEHIKATLLKEFIDTELVMGKLPFGVHFDDAFNTWKEEKRNNVIKDLSDKWGISYDWLLRSISAFDTSKPSSIPYIDEIIKSLDFSKAQDKSAGSQLAHTMKMMNELPVSISGIISKYY